MAKLNRRKLLKLAAAGGAGYGVVSILGCAPAAAPAPAATAAASLGTNTANMAALEAAGKAEGSVVMYTVASPVVISQVKKAFEAKYPGITATIQDTPAAQLKTKWSGEVASGNLLHDVIWQAEYTILKQNDAATAPLTDLPAWQAFPEKYKTPKYALISTQEKGIMINTNKVKQGEITKWTDVLDPKWKGLIVAGDPKGALATALTYIIIQKKFGDDWLKSLSTQQVNWQTGGAPAVALVGAGEKAFGISVNVGQYAGAKASGAPVGYVNLDPQGGSEHYPAVMQKAKHPAAARLLVNFLLSKEGQAAVNGGGAGASVFSDIPTALPLSSGYVLADESVPQAEIDRVSKLMGSP